MRGSEKVIVLVAVAIPLVVASYGWRMLGGWTPELPTIVAGAAATARAVQPTTRPTVGAPPTVRANASTPRPAAPPQSTAVPPVAASATAPTPEPAAAAAPSSDQPLEPAAAAAPSSDQMPEPPPVSAAGLARTGEQLPEPPRVAAVARQAATAPLDASGADPGSAVSSFYSLVSSHQFDSAAQLWSPRMRAAFPPQTNLHQRFSQTEGISLQRASVVSQNLAQATVQVDLVESNNTSGQQHYVGNWYLVRGPNGWLLDQPQLQTAP